MGAECSLLKTENPDIITYILMPIPRESVIKAHLLINIRLRGIG